MKNTYRIFTAGVLAVSMIFAASCTEKITVPVLDEEPDLSFEEGETIEIAAEPNTFSLFVNNHTDEAVFNVKYLSEDTGWLDVKYNQYGGKFHLTAYSNHTAEARSAELTVINTYKKASIRITQKAGDGKSYDPFAPDFPEKYFVMNWDDNWTMWNWIYHQGANGDPTDGKRKFECLNYGENGLTWHDYYFHLFETSGSISVGIKLSEELIKEIRGKLISQMAFGTSVSMVEEATLSIVTLKKSENPDLPDWCKDDCWSVDKVLYETSKTDDLDYRKDWLFWDRLDWTVPCPCPRIPEDADNLMILAKLKGDGKIINGGEDALLWAAPYPYPYNKFATTYINPDNNEGKDMYRFSAGTAQFNFVWVNKEFQPEE